jgi:predicted HTH transcriptional regulator
MVIPKQNTISSRKGVVWGKEAQFSKIMSSLKCWMLEFVNRFEKRIGSGLLKPSTNRMLNRIKSVYMFINTRGTVTTQELVEEFGITPRTIQRDLNVLAYNDLVSSPSRGKWTTTKKKVKLTS